jgi:hypothetical protein
MCDGMNQSGLSQADKGYFLGSLVHIEAIIKLTDLSSTLQDFTLQDLCITLVAIARV